MKEEMINLKMDDGLTLVSVKEKRKEITLIFDIDNVFKKSFCRRQRLKRWSVKRFEKWINNSILDGLEMLEKKYE